jgi:hypothetical protein
MTLSIRVAVVLILVSVVFLAGTDPLWAQCAMCRTALTGSAEGQQMAQGFNHAILFLLGAPYLVFGTLAASLWVKLRRKGALKTNTGFRRGWVLTKGGSTAFSMATHSGESPFP